MQINAKQFDQLQGFFTHCFCVYHENATNGFNFWAEQLDRHGIPWSVQNTVASLAEKKQNQQYYLRTLLKNNGIEVSN